MAIGISGVLADRLTGVATSAQKLYASLGESASAAVKTAVGYSNTLKPSTESSHSQSSTQNADKTKSSSDRAGQSTFKKYPLNLGDATYPHYINIYINANTKSKIVTEAIKNNKVDNVLIQNYDVNQNKTPKQTTSDNASKVISSMKIAGDKFSASRKSLKEAISLPLPQEIISSYSAEYINLSGGGIAGSVLSDIAEGRSMLDIGSRAGADIIQSAPGTALGALMTSLGAAVGSRAGPGGAMQGAEVFSKSVNGPALQSIINKSAGLATNERLEQTFKQMNFRQFTLNYVFAPRNAEESDTIQSIIKTLKLHMHPEIADQGAFLIIPNEFDIEFRFQGATNGYLHKIQTCYLENVVVNNTAGGHGYASFKDGAPVMISLQLHFKEIVPLTREMIERGY